MSRNPSPGRWQGLIAVLFLGAVVLMGTQYAVIKYGPAVVILSPVGVHGPGDIGESPVPDPDVPDELVQQPGVYVIDWSVLDQVAYRLDDGTMLPLPEGVIAGLVILALPLLFILRGRQLWPRWPLWMLALLGLLSCLGADNFRAAVFENAQWILVLLVTWWLAGVALVEEWHLRRLSLWLSMLTLALVALAYWDLYRFVVAAGPDGELPEAVRATCGSRTALGGLMVVLLPLAFGKVVGGGHKLLAALWAIVWVAGVSVLTSGGAVLALVVSAVVVCFTRGLKPGLAGLVLLPALVLGGGWLASKQHLPQLAESVQFAKRAPDGRAYEVEKRWLESAAALNGLLDNRYVLPPGAVEGEGGAEVVGYRSNLVGGVGAGQNYQKSIGGYYGQLDNPEKQEPDTYNLYLLLALQVGLFGALAWAWILCDGAALARTTEAGLSDPGLRGMALGVFGVCVGLLVFSLFGTVLIRGIGALFVVVLASGARLATLADGSRR